MNIFPAIDIKDGKCVRLKQGKFDDMTVYFEDPVKVSRDFKNKGAKFIHIVDLDGALVGKGINANLISKIKSETGLFIQTGGGIRNMNDIDEKIAFGVDRVILGTIAVENQDILKKAVEKYGEKIAVGIDAKNGFVATRGWENVTDKDAFELAKKMDQIGVKTIIYTDISRDGMLVGPNLESLLKMNETAKCHVIASGGISSYKDIEDVDNIGCYGVIIGKAIYNGNIDKKKVIDQFGG